MVVDSVVCEIICFSRILYYLGCGGDVRRVPTCACRVLIVS